MMTHALLARLRRLLFALPLRDRQGSVLVLTALSASALVAFCGLGMDVAVLYAERQAMQNAADAAAVGAAHAYAGGDSANYAAEGLSNAGQLGYVNGAGGVGVAIALPPSQGAFAGQSGYVEARISKVMTPTFMGLLMPSGWTVTLHAVAVATTSAQPGQTGSYCVLGLSGTAADTVQLDNNAVLPNSNCGIASNSTNASGLALSNNAVIAGSAAIGGTAYSLKNNAVIDGAVTTGVTTPDPYANVSVDTSGACTGQTASGKNNVTVNLTPGHFCSGLNFSNNAVVNMAAGVYVIDRQFSFSNNVVLNATGGVTLVLNGNYAVNIGNNAEINITAPTAGATSGIAIMGPRESCGATRQVFSNNAVFNIQGAVYFPSQEVDFENNATSDSNGCVQIIGKTVYFSNNVTLPTSCSGDGISPITPPINIKLVQ